MHKAALRKAWAGAAVAAALVVAMAGLAGCSSGGEDADDAATESGSSAAVVEEASDDGDAASTASELLTSTFADSNDETQNVIEHILADDASSILQSYTTAFLEGRSTLSTIALVLPLGSYVESCVEDGTGAAVEITYSDLSAVDEDAVRLALAYDATALFCCTSLNTITVSVGDDATYTFSREPIEVVLNDYAVTDGSLTSDLFVTQDDWETVRDALLQGDASEAMLEEASK